MTLKKLTDYMGIMYRNFLSISRGRQKGETVAEYFARYAAWLSDADLEAHYKLVYKDNMNIDSRFIAAIENEVIERSFFKEE